MKMMRRVQGFSLLEVLIADQQLFQLQLQLAKTRGDELQAFAQLYRSLGGGWQAEPTAGQPVPFTPVPAPPPLPPPPAPKP